LLAELQAGSGGQPPAEEQGGSETDQLLSGIAAETETEPSPDEAPARAEAETPDEALASALSKPPVPPQPDVQPPVQLFQALTPEERQKLLWVRIVTLNDFFKVLAAFNKADKKTREAIIDIGEAFTTLCESGVVEEPALNQIQEQVTAVEDVLLRIDESIPRDLFRRVLDEKQIPPEQLRRYARLLVSRPLPIGPRADRFDLLATHLLCVRTVSGYYKLLERRPAKAVLRDIVGGLDNRTSSEEREQTLATIRDASEKLPGFTSLEAFFESGFYLDAYGYKLSSRRQLVDPEILYNTVSLNAAVLNRLEELRGTRVAREELAKRLLQLEGEVRAILEPSRVKRDKKTRPRVSKRPSKPADKKKKKSQLSLDALLERYPILARIDPGKLKTVSAIALALVAAVSLYASGAVGGGSAGTYTAMDEAQRRNLSPILLQGWRIEEGSNTRFKGTVRPSTWKKMKVPDRARAAEALAKNLKADEIEDAMVSLFNTEQKAIEIVGGVVVYVDGRL
jgi:hypothetical protein